MSYNTLLNFVIGARGGGKTYAFKQYCIDDYLKNGKQFIWVRRYETELRAVKNSMFNDIKNAYPKLEITIKGNNIYFDKKLAGFFVSLSTPSKLKSSSYPNVNKIIFDEFLIDNPIYHYIRNEVELFLNLCETVFRTRTDVRAILIANAVTFYNPYFMYFNIRKFNTPFYSKNNITIEIYYNEYFTEFKNLTPFAQLISNTDFAKYSIDNEFLLDDEKFIKPLSKKAKYKFAIKYGKHTIGFFVDYELGEIYATPHHNPTSRIYTLKQDDHDINLLLIKSYRNTEIETLIYLYQNAKLFFTTAKIKSVVLEILGHFS